MNGIKILYIYKKKYYNVKLNRLILEKKKGKNYDNYDKNIKYKEK